jgi:hypothetical protein
MWPATGAGDGGGQVALRELQLQIDRTPQRPARRDEVELDSPMLAAAQRRRAQQVRAVEQRWHPARAEGLRLPLVRAIARRCTSRGEDLDDLVQGGAERLIRASARFGPGPWRRLRDAWHRPSEERALELSCWRSVRSTSAVRPCYLGRSMGPRRAAATSP